MCVYGNVWVYFFVFWIKFWISFFNFHWFFCEFHILIPLISLYHWICPLPLQTAPPQTKPNLKEKPKSKPRNKTVGVSINHLHSSHGNPLRLLQQVLHLTFEALKSCTPSPPLHSPTPVILQPIFVMLSNSHESRSLTSSLGSLWQQGHYGKWSHCSHL